MDLLSEENYREQQQLNPQVLKYHFPELNLSAILLKLMTAVLLLSPEGRNPFQTQRYCLLPLLPSSPPKKKTKKLTTPIVSIHLVQQKNHLPYKWKLCLMFCTARSRPYMLLQGRGRVSTAFIWFSGTNLQKIKCTVLYHCRLATLVFHNCSIQNFQNFKINCVFLRD